MSFTDTASFSSSFSAPFFGGIAVSEGPRLFPISLGGHDYVIDLDHGSVETISAWLREESLPLLRAQSDDGKEPSGASISPEQMWRRTQESWHHGAGQEFYDRDDSDRERFHESKGVDPWEKWHLGLLNTATRTDTFSSGSGSSIVSTGSRAYASSGANNFRTSSDLSSWSNVTGIPGTNCTSLATDGSSVYSAWGTSGIYITTAGATTAASFVTTGGSGITLVAYVKGRLLAVQGAGISNILGSGALPAAFYTHPNTNWTWTGFAEGNEFIYGAGFAGSFSAVYKIGIQPDGTALTPGTQAGLVPLGEVIRSIHGYLGFIVLGTDEGVRFCTATDTGDLVVGDLIETPQAVRCFTSFGRFTWFGWTGFDSSDGGLGRMDLRVINEGLVPAYASDLMVGSTNVVNGVATVNGVRVFTIDTYGIVVEQAGNPVDTGYLTTGQTGYGLADAKIAVFVDIRHEPLPANTSISVALAADLGSYTTIGLSDTDGSVSPETMPGMQTQAEHFELKFTLNSTASTGPKMRRWMLRSLPAPTRIKQWTLPLIWREVLHLDGGIEREMDVANETTFIRDRHEAQEIISFQFGPSTYQVVISDYSFLPDRLIWDPTVLDQRVWTGTMVVQLREIA